MDKVKEQHNKEYMSLQQKGKGAAGLNCHSASKMGVVCTPPGRLGDSKHRMPQYIENTPSHAAGRQRKRVGCLIMDVETTGLEADDKESPFPPPRILQRARPRQRRGCHILKALDTGWHQ